MSPVSSAASASSPPMISRASASLIGAKRRYDLVERLSPDPEVGATEPLDWNRMAKGIVIPGRRLAGAGDATDANDADLRLGIRVGRLGENDAARPRRQFDEVGQRRRRVFLGGPGDGLGAELSLI